MSTTMKKYQQTTRLVWANIRRYRSLIWALAIRELSLRYKGSALGFLWTFVNPILTMTIYSVVFGSLLKVGIDYYSLYLFAGLLLWGFISGALNDSGPSMRASAQLITKAALPPEIIPVRVLFSHVLNYLFTLPLYLLFCLVFWRFPGPGLIQVLIIVPIATYFVFSMLLGISVLGALFRDIQHLLPSILLLIFFTTPVMYRFDALPEWLQRILQFSPFTVIMKMNADVFFFGRWLEAWDVFYMLIISTLFFLASLGFLLHFRARIAERI